MTKRVGQYSARSFSARARNSAAAASSSTECTRKSAPALSEALATMSSVACTARRAPPACAASPAALTIASCAARSSPFWWMNQTLMKSGLRSSSRRTSARAASAEVILMMGGSPRSSFARSTMEISGPATATRGAAGRRGVLGSECALLELQDGPADIDDAGDTAREPDLERRGKAGLVALDFLRVGHPGVEVGDIGARVEVARLEEVDMRIDQSGNDPLAPAVDPRRPRRHGSRARRPDRLDTASGDDHGAVRGDRGRKISIGMNDRGADDRGDIRRPAGNSCQRQCCCETEPMSANEHVPLLSWQIEG